jgi:hypothetical protein
LFHKNLEVWKRPAKRSGQTELKVSRKKSAWVRARPAGSQKKMPAPLHHGIASVR